MNAFESLVDGAARKPRNTARNNVIFILDGRITLSSYIAGAQPSQEGNRKRVKEAGPISLRTICRSSNFVGRPISFQTLAGLGQENPFDPCGAITRWPSISISFSFTSPLVQQQTGPLAFLVERVGRHQA